MKCVRCGTELKENEKVCLGCGFEVGKEYIPEKNETLESLMELPVEEEIIDDAEELEITGTKKENDTIDGQVVISNNYLVGENKEKIKNKKNKKFLFIIPVLILIIIIIYFSYTYIKSLNNNSKPGNIENPKNDKVTINNYPTETYIYDSRFIFRLNNLWLKTDENTYVKNLSEFKIIKYEFEENSIEYYLEYINVENSSKKTINNIEYYYVINNDKEEYILIEKEQIYVLSFAHLEEEQINEILNTIKYYK